MPDPFLVDLIHSLQDRDGGIEIKDRRWNLRVFKQCFVGADLADWLIQHGHAKTRPDAIEIGNSLFNAGYIEHVTKAHDYADSAMLYHFVALETLDGIPSHDVREVLTDIDPVITGELGHSEASVCSLNVVDVCMVCEKHFVDPKVGVYCAECGVSVHFACQPEFEYQCPKSKWSRLRTDTIQRCDKATRIASYVNKDALIRAAGGETLGPERSSFYCIMLFADISGYTKLANKLIEKGEIGVEELSEHLTAYFSLLMSAVENHGGDIHKICGDAVLNVWKTNEDEADEVICQVLECAMKLLRIEYDTGDPETNLALHCGVGAGWLSSMVVGGVRGRLEHILMDDKEAPIAQVSLCVDKAKTGDILLSPQAAAHLASIERNKEKYKVQPLELLSGESESESVNSSGIVKLEFSASPPTHNLGSHISRSTSITRDRSGSMVGRIGSIIRGDRSRSSSPLHHRDKEKEKEKEKEKRSKSNLKSEGEGGDDSAASHSATEVDESPPTSPLNTVEDEEREKEKKKKDKKKKKKDKEKGPPIPIPNVIIEESDGATHTHEIGMSPSKGGNEGEEEDDDDRIEIKRSTSGVHSRSGTGMSGFNLTPSSSMYGMSGMSGMQGSPSVDGDGNLNVNAVTLIDIVVRLWDEDGVVPEVIEESIMPFLPFALRSRIQTSDKWLAELRKATVFFVQMPDLTLTSATDLTRMNRVFTAMQGAIYDQDGGIRQFLQDDKGVILIAMFGVPPHVHEDDCARAISAALSCAERLRVLRVKHRIGITTGRVYAGAVGSVIRREYSVVGAVVNLAARLMASCGMDDMRCDAATKEGAERDYEFEPMGSVKAKGFADLIPTFRPLHTKGDEKKKNQSESAFVGRNDEINLIVASLQQFIDSFLAASAGDNKSVADHPHQHQPLDSAVRDRGRKASKMTMGMGMGMTRQVSTRSAASGMSVEGLLRRENTKESLALGRRQSGQALHLKTLNAKRTSHLLAPSGTPRSVVSMGSQHAGIQAVYILEGDPGMGKSRIISEIQKQSKILNINTFVAVAETVQSGSLGVWGEIVSKIIFSDARDKDGSNPPTPMFSPFKPKRVMASQVASQEQGPPSRPPTQSPVPARRVSDTHNIGDARRASTDVDRLRDEAYQYAQILEEEKQVSADRMCLLNGVIPNLRLPETLLVKRMGAEARSRSTIELIVQILRYEADKRPILICIDDAQWMDSLSRDMLVAVATRGVFAPIIVSTRVEKPRSEELTKILAFNHVKCLSLSGLPANDIEKLAISRVGGVDGSRLPSDLTDLICDRSQGSPLIVEELMSSLIDNGSIMVNDRGHAVYSGNVTSVDHMNMPESLNALIVSRIAKLPRSQEMALKVASVIGKTVPLDLIAAVFPSDLSNAGGDDMKKEVKYMLDGLTSKGMLDCNESDGDNIIYSFKHSSTLDAAYGTMLFAQRRELHLEVGRYILEIASSDDQYLRLQYGVLAHHFSEAHHFASAFKYLVLAADNSFDLFAMNEALAQYDYALKMAEEHGKEIQGEEGEGDGSFRLSKARIHARRCIIFLSCSRYEDCSIAGMHFCEMAGYSKPAFSKLGAIRQLLSGAIVQRGFYKHGASYKPSHMFTKATDPSQPLFLEAGQVYLSVAQSRFFMLEKIPSISGAVRGLNIAEQIGHKTPEKARAYATVAMACLALRKKDLMRKYEAKALETLEDVKAAQAKPYCMFVLGSMHASDGNYERGYNVCVEGTSLAYANNEYRTYELCLGQTAICLANWGRFVESATLAMKVLDSTQVSENAASRILAYFYLVWAQANLGHLDDAVDNAERGWSVAQGDEIQKIDKARSLALLSLANCWSGVPERVAIAADQAFEAVEMIGLSTVNSSSLTYDAAATAMITRLQMLMSRKPTKQKSKSKQKYAQDYIQYKEDKKEFKKIGENLLFVLKIMKKFAKAYDCLSPRQWLVEGCYLSLVKKDYPNAALLFAQAGRFAESRSMNYDMARAHYFLGRYCIPPDSVDCDRRYVRAADGGFESQRAHHLRAACDMFEEMECAFYWERATELLLDKKGAVFGDRNDNLTDEAEKIELNQMSHMNSVVSRPSIRSRPSAVGSHSSSTVRSFKSLEGLSLRPDGRNSVLDM